MYTSRLSDFQAVILSMLVGGLILTLLSQAGILVWGSTVMNVLLFLVPGLVFLAVEKFIIHRFDR